MSVSGPKKTSTTGDIWTWADPGADAGHFHRGGENAVWCASLLAVWKQVETDYAESIQRDNQQSPNAPGINMLRPSLQEMHGKSHSYLHSGNALPNS